MTTLNQTQTRTRNLITISLNKDISTSELKKLNSFLSTIFNGVKFNKRVITWELPASDNNISKLSLIKSLPVSYVY